MSKINFVTLLFFILNIPNAIGKDEDYIGGGFIGEGLILSQ